MNMDIILDQVAIWRACGAKTLNRRVSPAGIIVRNVDSPVYNKAAVPIIRYCKDYEVGSGKSKVAYCLFVRSKIDNDEFIEQQLDDVAKQITKEQALKASANATTENFEYLPKIIGMEV